MDLDGGVIGEVGLAGQHVETAYQQFGSDVECGGYAQIVDIWIEGQTQAADAGRAPKLIFQSSSSGLNLLDPPTAVAVIYAAGCLNQGGAVGCGGGDAPWIRGDAVSAHAGASLQQIHPGVVIDQADQLANVDSEVIADKLELVGEGDIDIAEAVFGGLHQLGGDCCGGQ